MLRLPAAPAVVVVLGDGVAINLAAGRADANLHTLSGAGRRALRLPAAPAVLVHFLRAADGRESDAQRKREQHAYKLLHGIFFLLQQETGQSVG